MSELVETLARLNSKQKDELVEKLMDRFPNLAYELQTKIEFFGMDKAYEKENGVFSEFAEEGLNV